MIRSRVRRPLLGALAVLMLWSIPGLAETSKHRLTLRDDPANSVVIGWCQDSGEDAAVHFGPADHGRDAEAYPHRHEPDRSVAHKGLDHRFARLTGLEPDTAYYFVIHDSDSTSERFWFRTAPADGSPLRIVAGGDSRNHHDARRDANRMVAKLRPHCVTFGGDMTVRGSPEEWAQWLEDWQLTTADDGRMTPVVAARGNHEPSNEDLVNIFDVPSDRVYYALDIGGGFIRLYTLNTEISVGGEQTRWLGEDLAEHPEARWKLVQYHKPMWPHTGGKAEGKRIYDAWAELFYEHRVNLVVECDSHMVKRTWPIRPSTGSESDSGFVRDDESGTVYIGEGCWGAPLRPANDPKAWTRDLDSFNQVKWIRVAEDGVTVRTVRVDNAKEVGSVDEAAPWRAPENLAIWDPDDGAELHLEPFKAEAGQ